MIRLEDVHFTYGETPLLNGVSLHIQPEEIASLIGLSGSGKTTLFRLITSLEKADRGTLSLDGEVTYMQQQDLLLPWRTVLGNLLLIDELGEKTPKRREEALTLLNKVGLMGCADKYPEELSGGMRQRVSLARALMQKRPILLLDEPFGPLDVLIREELYQLLRQIRKTEKKTILLVTHDFNDALSLSDSIFILASGQIANRFTLTDEMRQDPLLLEELKTKIKQTLSTSALQPAS